MGMKDLVFPARNSGELRSPVWLLLDRMVIVSVSITKVGPGEGGGRVVVRTAPHTGA